MDWDAGRDSGNGMEFTAKRFWKWLSRLGVATPFIKKGSPWENGYFESFNGEMRDELLYQEVFYALREAQILIEDWRCHYNTQQPHSALGCRPPAPKTILPRPLAPVPLILT